MIPGLKVILYIHKIFNGWDIHIIIKIAVYNFKEMKI